MEEFEEVLLLALVVEFEEVAELLSAEAAEVAVLGDDVLSVGTVAFVDVVKVLESEEFVELLLPVLVPFDRVVELAVSLTAKTCASIPANTVCGTTEARTRPRTELNSMMMMTG